MPRARFLNVTFKFSGAPDEAKLKSKFDLAIDWIRYSPEGWLIWSNSSRKKWTERLKGAVRKGDDFFIVEVNIARRGGVMPRAFWQFIRSHQLEDTPSKPLT